MKSMMKPLAVVSCVLGLAACGGGGGSDADTGGGLNGAGTNGLPFAGSTVGNGGDVGMRAAGNTVGTQGALLTSGSGGPVVLTPVTVTGVSADRITIRFDDQNFTVDRISPDEVHFGNDELGGRMIAEGDDVASAFFGRIDDSSGDGTRGVFFVVGNETDPANLSGSAIYLFDLEGIGVESTSTPSGEPIARGLTFAGEGAIRVNFANAGISGDMTIDALGIEDNLTTVSGDFLISGEWTGNAYSATLELQGCLTGATCTSSSMLQGNFFGPSGNETAGIGILDESVMTQDGLGQTVGIFTFLGERGIN